MIASFDSIYEAADQIKQSAESIMNVIHREFLTAGGFRWFLQTYIPDKTDFTVNSHPDTIPDILNTSL